MPYELMVKDTLLWVMDGAFDHMLRIFDHRQGRLIDSAGVKGTGYGELVGPWTFVVGPSAFIHVYDLTGKRISAYRYQEGEGWVFHAHLDAAVPANFNNAFWLSDSIFIASTDDLNGRIGSFNVNTGHFQVWNNTFPPKISASISDPLHAELSAGKIAVNRKNGKVALASRHMDRIDIYDLTGTSQKVIIGPEGHLPVFRTETAGGSESIVWKRDKRYGYLAIASAGNCFIGLYSGRSYETHGDYDNCGDALYAFDWEGACVKKLILDVELIDLFFEEESKALYGITSDRFVDGGDVVKIDLNEII